MKDLRRTMKYEKIVVMFVCKRGENLSLCPFTILHRACLKKSDRAAASPDKCGEGMA
jgi:hypothetical protein